MSNSLLAWQWETYSRNHLARSNLLLHIVVVPLFLLANVGLLFALWQHLWLASGLCASLMLVSVALQGRGHRWEAQAPIPFTGPFNAIARIFLEQWITFPRFVISGGFWTAFHAARVNVE